MELSEESVDENLTDYLKKPVEKKKRTFSEIHEEDTVSENEEETQPATKKTKDEIYHLWTQAWHEEGEKLLQLVQKLGGMSEQEAKAYLACLKAVSSRHAHKNLTEKLLLFASNIICHPNDITTPLAMQEDDYLKTGAALLVSDVLAFLGRLGFVALLFAYGGTSRYYHKQTREKQITPAPRATADTVQNDGVRQGSNGENNANDQAND